MSILGGFYKQDRENARVATLEKKLGSAKVHGKKKCLKCGFCCHKRTCIPTPKELGAIAKFLKLTPHECIKKFFAIDRQNWNSVYYVRPLGENIKDLAGKFIPGDRTYNEGKCIFLAKSKKKYKCKIYPARPSSAHEQRCWAPDGDYSAPLSSWKDSVLETKFNIPVDEDEGSD